MSDRAFAVTVGAVAVAVLALLAWADSGPRLALEALLAGGAGLAVILLSLRRRKP